MKVVANLGLCIFVNDIRSIVGGFVFPRNSASTYTVYLNLKFGFHTLSISDCVMPTYSAVEKDDRLDQFLWNVQLFQFFLCSYNN